LGIAIIAARIAIVLVVIVLLILLKRKRVDIEVDFHQISSDTAGRLNPSSSTSCEAHAMSNFEEIVTQNDGDPFTYVE
jgi:hypothetical protein